VLRKRLWGVAPEMPLPEEAYAEQMGERVYAAHREQAAVALHGGCAVIADAVFARPGERAAIESVAASAGVPFVGVWLEAPPGVLEQRVADRSGDASDAGVAVVRQQMRYDIGRIDWTTLQAGDDRSACLARAREALGDRLGRLARQPSRQGPREFEGRGE
jgi:predicted kinase